MSKVVSLAHRRISKAVKEGYAVKLSYLNKMELMDEMVRFQEERSALGRLTPELIERGLVLFRVLHDAAETHELRLLTGAYLKHLEYERGSHD